MNNYPTTKEMKLEIHITKRMKKHMSRYMYLYYTKGK